MKKISILLGVDLKKIMLIVISLLFSDNAEEAEGEEVSFNDEVHLFSAMTLFSEEESAFGEVLISLFAFCLEFVISFLAEDNSAEEESDSWLKSSYVF